MTMMTSTCSTKFRTCAEGTAGITCVVNGCHVREIGNLFRAVLMSEIYFLYFSSCGRAELAAASSLQRTKKKKDSPTNLCEGTAETTVFPPGCRVRHLASSFETVTRFVCLARASQCGIAKYFRLKCSSEFSRTSQNWSFP